jgi:hypothetical protein
MGSQSVKAVLRATPAAEGEEPVRVPAGAQRAALEALRVQIAGASADAHISTWNKATTLQVPIALPRGRDDPYSFPDRVYVFFSGEEMQVAQEVGPSGVPLAGAPHMRRIIEAVQERLRDQRGRLRKREKLRGLKARFIETQIEAIAARAGVKCTVHPRATRVEARVTFGSRAWEGITVHIPYGRAEEVLAELPAIFTAARELYRRGERARATFTFEVRSYPRTEKPA